MKYVFRTKLGYYKFARKIPNTNRQFIFSLKTKNLRIAKKITQIFLLKTADYYKMLQNMYKDEIMIREDEIISVLKEYEKAARKEYSEFEKSRHAHFKFDKMDGAHPDAIEFWLDEMRKHVCGRHSERETIEFVRKILARATTNLKLFYKTVTAEEKLYFLQALMKAEASLLKLDHRRSQQYFSVDHNEPQQSQPESIELVLRKLLDEKLGLGKTIVKIDKADAIESYKKSAPVVKRYKKEAYMFEHSFNQLLNVCDKRHLNDYTMEDYDLFMETFVWTPAWQGGRKSFHATVFNSDDTMVAKYFKKYYIESSDEDLDFAIDENYPYDPAILSKEVLDEFEKLDVQSKSTLGNKLTILRNFFKHCVDKNFIEKSPFTDEQDYKWKELVKDVGNAIKTRNPFSAEELNKMFRIFVEKDFFKDENLAYFYVPMIAFFSGMRIEEICKLRKMDIIKENGVYCFDINGYVKTVDSIRKVPIHKFLLKNLRLLEYIDSREDLLFDLPTVVINRRVKYSKKYSAIFGEFRKDFVSEDRIEKDLVSFHSLRHHFSSSLSSANVQVPAISALLGHRLAANETKTYLHKNPEELSAVLSKLQLKNFKTELDLISIGFSKVKFKKVSTL
jgi:integrase